MALGDGANWDETVPTDATVAVNIDDYNRDLRVGVRSRMAHEHEWPSSQSATSPSGKHKFITLQNQSTKPTLSGTQVGAVYQKTSALYFENSAGNEVIITDGTELAYRAGAVIQTTRNIVTAYSSTAATIPYDDTIPQIGEGRSISTCTMTPLFATSLIKYYAWVIGPVGANQNGSTLAVFINGSSDAVNASFIGPADPNQANIPPVVGFYQAAATTGVTFEVRGGHAAGGAFIVNGQAGAGRKLGGVATSGIILEEIKQ